MRPPYPWLDLNSPALALLRESFYPHYQHDQHYLILSSLTKETSQTPPSPAPSSSPAQPSRPTNSTITPTLVSAPLNLINPSSIPPALDSYPRQSALSTFHSWSFKDRCCSGLAHPTIPHFITATAGLIEAQLHDHGLHLPPPQQAMSMRKSDAGAEYEVDTNRDRERQRYISDGALCSVYAMAFGRFVTGFVDRDVTRRGVKPEQERKGGSSGKRKREGTSGRESKRSSGGRLPTKRRKTAGGTEGTLSQDNISESSDDSGDDYNAETISQTSTASLSDSQTNPTADSQPNKSLPTRRHPSMYTSAALLNLPRAFVDLRHRSTHAFSNSHSSSSPTLPEWRRAMAEALDWIYREFWEKSVNGDSSVERRRLEIRRRECEEGRKRREGGGETVGLRVLGEQHTALDEQHVTVDEDNRRLGEAEPLHERF